MASVAAAEDEGAAAGAAGVVALSGAAVRAWLAGESGWQWVEAASAVVVGVQEAAAAEEEGINGGEVRPGQG